MYAANSKLAYIGINPLQNLLDTYRQRDFRGLTAAQKQQLSDSVAPIANYLDLSNGELNFKRNLVDAAWAQNNPNLVTSGKCAQQTQYCVGYFRIVVVFSV